MECDENVHVSQAGERGRDSRAVADLALDIQRLRSLTYRQTLPPQIFFRSTQLCERKLSDAGQLRFELLNREILDTLKEAQVIAESWR